MKTPYVIACIFSVGIVGLVAGLGAARCAVSGSQSGRNDAAVLERLEERLGALETRIQELAKLESDVAKLGSKPSGLTAELVEEPAEGSVDGDVLIATNESEEVKPQTKLDRWLQTNGMRDDLEQFVAQVYQTARDSRRTKEREEAEARAKEEQAFREGPYGKFNYRVNSLAKRINLDTRQKDYLYNLLKRYDDRRDAQMRDLEPLQKDSATPDQIAAHFQHIEAIQKSMAEEFDGELSRVLTADQQELYAELSSGEKGVDRGPRIVEFFGAEEGLKLGVEKLRIDGDMIHLPVAPPAPGATGGAGGVQVAK